MPIGAVEKGRGYMIDVLTSHLEHLTRLERCPSTIAQRAWTLRRLARHVTPTGFLDVSLDDLRRFLDRPPSAGRHPRGPEARATEVSHLRGFYRWAVLEELLDSDPTLRLERPARPRRLPRPMPDPDVQHALRYAPDRIRPWLHLAAYAGLRACEIAPLRREDISNVAIIVRVQKGGDMGVVPLHPSLLAVLAPLPASGWLFPHRGHAAVGPTSAGQVSRLASRWLHEAGIDHTLHTLRHWYGTNVYRASGRDLRQTQELLRHRSPSSTAIYTAIDVDEAGETVARLPTVASLGGRVYGPAS